MRERDELSSSHIEDFLGGDDKGKQGERKAFSEEEKALYERALEISNRLYYKVMENSTDRFEGQPVKTVHAFIMNLLRNKLPGYFDNQEKDKIEGFEDFLDEVEDWLDELES
jgi:N-formylglutamate amidohydrolase